MIGAARMCAAGALAALLGGVLVTACASSGSVESSSETPNTSSRGSHANVAGNGQVFVVTRLRQDYSALDRGVLAYTPIKTLETGQSTSLYAFVTDIGKRAPKQTASVSEVSKESGLTVYPYDVPTGGIVSLHVTCSNLQCQEMTTARQAVVIVGQPVEWVWFVTASSPGPAMITLAADTYDQLTDTVLREETVQISVIVQATAAYKHRRAVAAATPATGSGGGGNGGVVLGGIFAIIAAAVGAIITRVQFGKRKKRRHEAATDGPPSAASQTGGTPDS